MTSILSSSSGLYTNPISAVGNSGLTSPDGAEFANVTLTNGSNLTVSGSMTIQNTKVDGTATMTFNDAIDFGKLAPATPGGNFTFLKAGPVDIDLGATTAYNTLDSKATIGVSGGRLIANGALAHRQLPRRLAVRILDWLAARSPLAACLPLQLVPRTH